jgi:hypothetical protein
MFHFILSVTEVWELQYLDAAVNETWNAKGSTTQGPANMRCTAYETSSRLVIRNLVTQDHSVVI